MSATSARVAVATTRPSLGARVVRRSPLLYRRGADASLDRPPHVRAGSALARIGPGAFAVIQDDASFVAVLEASRDGARDLPLPGDEGRRLFDDTRGNKARKLDLEAAVFLGGSLVAFGSGSTPARERIVIVDAPLDEAASRVTVRHAPELYALLRDDRTFAGSELNVEGAALAGDDILFFQRGNGAARDGAAPVDATARVSVASLLAYLDGSAGPGGAHAWKAGPLPVLREVMGWELGAVDGTRLTFTDGVAARGPWSAFLACAEACPDATRDGPVTGVRIGRLDDRRGVAELAPVLDERGEALLDKTEGLALDPDDATRAWAVVDKDDPEIPSELLELELGEGWAS